MGTKNTNLFYDDKTHIPATHIPATILIGVTGHRKISNAQLLRKSIKIVLGQLDKILTYTPYTFVTVSPLAEGADRLVAREVLD